MGLSPYPLRSVLTLVSVRIELNCSTPSWCHRKLLGVGKKPTHLVSEILCVGGKEKHRVIFP